MGTVPSNNYTLDLLVEADDHAAHAVLVALVGTVQALARQHLVFLADAACGHLPWRCGPLVNHDVHHLLGGVVQLQVPVAYFHGQFAIWRRALPCLCRRSKQKPCGQHPKE